jgi:hypothetical protein
VYSSDNWLQGYDLMVRLNRGNLISICISLFVPARNDILPEAYAMAVSSKICIASNDLEKLPVLRGSCKMLCCASTGSA